MIQNEFKPKISIIIPVYNGANYLAKALESALAQTYHNIEIIVANDGSNDNGETERIALSYGDKIRYFSKPNGGVASALNLAIDKMSGDFFSWLSHDDLYVKEKIAVQIEALSNMPSNERENTILYSNYYTFTKDPEDCVPIFLSGVSPSQFRYWITTENTLHGCTLLIPKKAFTEIGRFKEQLRTTQDYDMWFTLAKKYRFVHLPQHLVKARSHSEQGSIQLSGIAHAECNSLLSGFVLDLAANELPFTSTKELSLAYAKLADNMWFRGFKKTGFVAANLSLKNFKGASLRSNIMATSVLMKGLFAHYNIQSIKKFIPQRLRNLIRNYLQNKNAHESQNTESLANLSLKDKFSAVYHRNIFRGRVSRSGEGSDLIQTAIIREVLPKLLKELNVKTILDSPCGDWYWMQKIELPVEKYIGLDIVEQLIEKNQNTFGNSMISFECKNLAEDQLPKSDLILSRDCLVHLSFADALKIIANFKRSGAKYLLTTTFSSRDKNEDLGQGFWRPLNKQLAPFNFPVPIRLINEACTEGNHLFKDKCLGLWRLEDIDTTNYD